MLVNDSIRAFSFALLLFFLPIQGQEACIDGCRFPDYPGITFALGDGFLSKGGPVSVTHMGFLKSGVYNNNGAIQPVGLPTLVGALYFINPVTGLEEFLFNNQNDGVTHRNDEGKTIHLGVFPLGAPIVFKFKNLTGSESKRFDRFTGNNEVGVYNFDANPLLKSLAINGKPMPRSGGSWNWSGVDHFQWSISGMVPDTDIKQFQFEDLDDRRFNDIVFRVFGVALKSESITLEAPLLMATRDTIQNVQIVIQNSSALPNSDAKIFYTLDGSLPTYSVSGTPTGTTQEYLVPILLTTSTTVTAVAWKPAKVDQTGNSTEYKASAPVQERYRIAHVQWSQPMATPPGGEFSLKASVSVILNQAEGAKMFYRICDLDMACLDPDLSSPSYANIPLVLSTHKTLKVIAIQAPNQNSLVAVFTFSPRFSVLDAFYLDRDGDGRIETAKIILDGIPSAPPSSVLLIDPFKVSDIVDAGALSLVWDPLDPKIIFADFSATPFLSGTAFNYGPLGRFKSAGFGYDTKFFVIRDGTGPVVASAEAFVSLEGGTGQRLQVKYSEPLREPLQLTPIPFTVKRKGEDITAKLSVSKVRDLGNSTYEYSFASDDFPFPGDSVQASTMALDIHGNASNMSFWIPITGAGLKLTLSLKVTGGGCVRSSSIYSRSPLRIPLRIIAPETSAGSSGCTALPPAIQCLDCLTQEWKRLDPNRPDSENWPMGPQIQVTTQAPFYFDLTFFNTMGEFVNRARGEVTETMLGYLNSDRRGNKSVNLQWYPVSERGIAVGTGAYIVKGFITLKPKLLPDRVPAPFMPIETVTSQVLLRFGYLRN